MKIRIQNDNTKPLKVILEPWATEIEVVPGDYIEFVSEGAVPDDAYFAVHKNEYGIIVFPEWDRALVYGFDSSNEKID